MIGEYQNGPNHGKTGGSVGPWFWAGPAPRPAGAHLAITAAPRTPALVGVRGAALVWPRRGGSSLPLPDRPIGRTGLAPAATSRGRPR
jgi:hypothetical protein